MTKTIHPFSPVEAGPKSESIAEFGRNHFDEIENASAELSETKVLMDSALDLLAHASEAHKKDVSILATSPIRRAEILIGIAWDKACSAETKIDKAIRSATFNNRPGDSERPRHDKRTLNITGLEAGIQYTIQAGALLEIVQFYGLQLKDLNRLENPVEKKLCEDAMAGIGTLMALTSDEIKTGIEND